MIPLDPAPGPAAPARPPRFSRLLTAFCSVVVLVYIALPLGPHLTGATSPLGQLERPEESLDRLVTRELDLEEAMRAGPRWERRLFRFLSGGGDPVEEAAGWYEELLEEVDSPSAELHAAILAAESGQRERALEMVSRQAPEETFAVWLRAAYADPPPNRDGGRAAIARIRAETDPSWFRDTLVLRIATRAGDTTAGAEAEAARIDRGRGLVWRLRMLTALVTALLAAGVVGAIRARRRGPPVGDAQLPPAWSGADGYALLVRGVGIPQALLLGAALVLRGTGTPTTPLAMAADLPLFWWVARYLRATDSGWRAAFGVPARAGSGPRLAAVAAMLIGVALVGDSAIDTLTTWAGFQSHWADGFAEDLLWDSRGQFAIDALNVTVWAPMVEEVTFRGLLYGTLRTRLSVAPATVLSAVVFAVPHGYAAAGTLSVLMSGVLWALAYERTRSLLPGLIAHAVNNLMSTLWVVTLLR